MRLYYILVEQNLREHIFHVYSNHLLNEHTKIILYRSKDFLNSCRLLQIKPGVNHLDKNCRFFQIQVFDYFFT